MFFRERFVECPTPTALCVLPQCLVTWAGAWSRVLLASEHAALAASPWQVFLPPRDLSRLYAGMSGRRVSYPRCSSALHPVRLPTADLYCHLD